MAFIYDLTDTWNAGGTTFSAIKMNVTDTASASASKLITVQVGGAEKFGVRKDGQGYFAGNVGIGTSSPSAVGSRTTLNVSGSNGSAIRLSDDTANAYIDYTDGSGARFSVNAAEPLLLQTNSLERMRIDSVGNVGIGTSAPDSLIEASDPTSATIKVTKSGGTAVETTLFSSSSGVGGVGTVTNQDFTFRTNSTERMRIDSSGNVGIGTTSPSSYGGKLNVADAAAGGETTLVVTNSSVNQFVRLGINADTAQIAWDNQDVLAFGIAPTSATSGLTNEWMRITGSGNVGIGTTSPGARVDLGYTGGSVALRISRDASNRLDFYQGGGVSYIDSSPAGAQLAFSTVGSERMRIDSSGNVGIGTSSPATLTAGITALSISDQGAKTTGTYADGIGAAISAVATSATGAAYGLSFTTATITGSNRAERVRITETGSVGIGTSSPESKLDVYNPSGTQGIIVKRSTTTSAAPYMQLQAAAANTRIDATGALAFNTAAIGGSPAERLRIDSSGNLLVGKTSSSTSTVGVEARSDGFLTATRNASLALNLRRNTSDGSIAQFQRDSTTVGSISVTTSATAYNTSSDYRLKDIDGPVANSGAYIDALKPVQGSWKADGSRFIGLLAHEVQEVSETQIATGEKDGEEMQAMDYSSPELIANLIAEIQSLRARVAQLEG